MGGKNSIVLKQNDNLFLNILSNLINIYNPQLNINHSVFNFHMPDYETDIKIIAKLAGYTKDSVTFFSSLFNIKDELKEFSINNYLYYINEEQEIIFFLCILYCFINCGYKFKYLGDNVEIIINERLEENFSKFLLKYLIQLFTIINLLGNKELSEVKLKIHPLKSVLDFPEFYRNVKNEVLKLLRLDWAEEFFDKFKPSNILLEEPKINLTYHKRKGLVTKSKYPIFKIQLFMIYLKKLINENDKRNFIQINSFDLLFKFKNNSSLSIICKIDQVEVEDLKFLFNSETFKIRNINFTKVELKNDDLFTISVEESTLISSVLVHSPWSSILVSLEIHKYFNFLTNYEVSVIDFLSDFIFVYVVSNQNILNFILSKIKNDTKSPSLVLFMKWNKKEIESRQLFFINSGQIMLKDTTIQELISNGYRFCKISPHVTQNYINNDKIIFCRPFHNALLRVTKVKNTYILRLLNWDKLNDEMISHKLSNNLLANINLEIYFIISYNYEVCSLKGGNKDLKSLNVLSEKLELEYKNNNDYIKAIMNIMSSKMYLYICQLHELFHILNVLHNREIRHARIYYNNYVTREELTQILLLFDKFITFKFIVHPKHIFEEIIFFTRTKLSEATIEQANKYKVSLTFNVDSMSIKLIIYSKFRKLKKLPIVSLLDKFIGNKYLLKIN